MARPPEPVYKSGMHFEELRRRHPAIVYRSFHCAPLADGLRVEFSFHLEPDIDFRPRIVLPKAAEAHLDALTPLIFQLGLVELLSYWKCACPERVVIEAGELESEQLRWWHRLFINGLSEFYYKNDIDFTAPDLVRIEAREAPPRPAALFPQSDGDLILVGGGKDSVVTLELLRDQPGPRGALILGEHRAAFDSVQIAGYGKPLVIRRTIDERLRELNREGYLNGHTPFSAYLAFAGVIAAAAAGYRRVIASNESSSNEPNTVLFGRPINHQYSKTRELEVEFREYCARWLTPSIEYFSMLRPLNELQICRLFSRHEPHFATFRSCNVNQRESSWCGSCPKCAFTALSLSPFLPQETLRRIFSDDIFENPVIRTHVRELVGLEGHKPFECVGTTRESIAAIQLTRKRSEPLPALFEEISNSLAARDALLPEPEAVLREYDTDHSVPAEYETLLRKAMSNA